MGIFSKKDKEREKKHPDLLNPVSTAPPPNSGTTNPALQHSQSSYNDSAYHSTSGSNVTEDPSIRKQQQQALQNQPPGTTVTTTTTTTTTVTTVTSDGRTFTQVHPYNPVTDPPIRTQETTSPEDTSRTSTIGGSSNTNSISNPNSATNIPQSQNNAQTAQTSQLQPGPQRPEVQRTISPGRKPTPQELQSDSHFNIIPPTPQGSQSSQGPQSPTTTGGRIIPPRSDRRTSPRGSFGNSTSVSPEFLPDGPVSPGPPMRSEKRNSMDRGLNVAPLRTSHSPSNSQGTPISAGGYGQDQPRSSYEAPPSVPPKDHFGNYRDQRDSGYAQNQVYPEHDQSGYNSTNPSSTYIPVGGNSYDPQVSGGAAPDNRSNPPQHYTRPGPTVTSLSQQFDAPPTSASAMHPPADDLRNPAEKHSHRKSLANTYHGILGASEVIRGTINSSIAKGTHDKAEEERMRAIREKGLQDYKASGLGDRMWGGRVAERSDGSRRLRKRSLSRNGVHGSEGAGGLEPVEERSIGSQ